MMGPRQRIEPKLYYTGISLADRIPQDHPLRQIDRLIDFGFVREAVRDCYGHNGQESVDPIVLMKLMILLYLEQVPSERKLAESLGYRIDWLWFCGYDFDDDLPNHSVLSKARRRWGPEVFAELFGRILLQCIEAGLVGGEVLHVDGSCIQGNVDMDRLQPVLTVTGQSLYDRLEAGVEPTHPHGRLTACSDPEAGVTRKNGQTVCGYKDHRAVDDAKGVITATITTDAACDEGKMLTTVLDEHERNVSSRPQTVVADKQYGTGENYEHLQAKGIAPCIPHAKHTSPRGRFGRDAFTYHRQRDCFVCPAGHELRPYHRNKSEQRIRYRAAQGVCVACPLRSRCTSSKHGRRVERHMKQDAIDWADTCLSPPQRRALMRQRKIRAEGSFAEAERYHFKRSRWCGLISARIQNLLIASILNLRTLLKAVPGRLRSAERCLRRSCGHFLTGGFIPIATRPTELGQPNLSS